MISLHLLQNSELIISTVQQILLENMYHNLFLINAYESIDNDIADFIHKTDFNKIQMKTYKLL